MAPNVPSVSADPHVFLTGRPPLSEYLGFIAANAVDGAAADQGALANAWRRANDHIRELEIEEAGWADSPTVLPLPGDVHALRDRLLGDPIIQRTFALFPVEVGLVELERMVVFQKQINVAYAASLRAALGDDPTPEDLFRFCLPIEERRDPPVHGQRIAQNAWAFVSPSSDFRLLDAVMIDPSTVAGLPTTGVPTHIIGLVVGYGSNLLSAVRIEDRLVLRNGSHRAYALLEAGHTHVPCVIQDISRREELEAAGMEDVTANPDLYLTAPRPPVLKDYFDEQLRMLVDVPKKVRQVRLAFNQEPLDVPA